VTYGVGNYKHNTVVKAENRREATNTVYQLMLKDKKFQDIKKNVFEFTMDIKRIYKNGIGRNIYKSKGGQGK
jgi:hypothetical protein